MTFSAGNITATFGAGLATGVYNVGARSRDAAGNWSLVAKSILVVYDPSIQGVTGKNKQGFGLVYGSDALPWLTATLSGQADYGFTVDWLGNGALDPHNDFHFEYDTGTQCQTPHPQNCHSVILDATSFAQLAIDQTNNSRARFQGTAAMVIDNSAATSNPFTIEGLDGDRLTPSVNDTFALKIFAVGANPNTATPIYHVNVTLDKGNAIKVR